MTSPTDNDLAPRSKRLRNGELLYLDSTPPQNYLPDLGETQLSYFTLEGLADLYGSDKGSLSTGTLLITVRS